MRRVLAFGLVLAFLVALLPAAPLFAQAADEVFCGDLEAEDCAILEDAAMADKEVTEGAYQMDLSVLLEGVPNAPFDDFAFDAVLSSLYSTDPMLSEEVQALAEAGQEAADVDMLAQLLGALVEGVDTYQTISVMFPADVAEVLGAQMGAPLPEEMSVSYAIVDGMGYVDLDSLAESFPEAEGLTGWIGTELGPVLDELLAQIAEDPEMQAALAPAFMGVGGGLAGQQMAAEQAEALADFMDIQRLEDMTVEGEDVAVFETTFDFVALASSPVFMDMVAQQLEMMGEDAPSTAELAQVQFMMPMIAPMIFGGLDYTITNYISLDSGYTLLGELVFDWDLSTLAGLAAMAGEDLGELPSFFGMNVAVFSFNQNDVGELEAPEGAMVVPAESIVASMQQ